MEKKNYKIMDALLLESQEPVAPERDNYVFDEEANQRELDAVNQNSAKKKEKGLKNRSPEEPIDIEGEVQPIIPNIQEEQPQLPAEREVVQPRVDQLKSSLLPQEEIQVEQDAVLENGVNSGVGSMQEASEEYPNFWVGAAPLLMGAILGDIGAGAEEGGNALMQRYKDERDAAKAQWKSRSTASETKKLQKMKYRGPEGEMLMGSYNPATGEKFDAFGKSDNSISPSLNYEEKVEARASVKDKYDMKSGKHMTRFRNMNTGKDMIWDKRSGTISQMAGQLPSLGGEQLAFVKGVKDKAFKEKPAIDKYRKMSSSIRGFTSGTPEAQRIAFKSMAKALEGGKLSDFDMIYLQDAWGLWNKMERKVKEQFKAGKMEGRQARNFASEMAKALKKSQGLMNETYSRHYADGELVGIDREAMKGYVGEPIGMYDKVLYTDKKGVKKRANIDQIDNIVDAGFGVTGYE